MCGVTYIYALFDPRYPATLRYVGKANDVVERLKAHIYLAKRKATNPRLCWVQSLLNAGRSPVVRILEEAPKTHWQGREQHWIATLRAAGHALTNVTDGGDGGASCRGVKHAPRTAAHRAKIAAAHLGKPLSLQHRLKIGAAHRGRKHSATQVANRAAALRGKLRTPESKARMARSARKAWARRRSAQL